MMDSFLPIGELAKKADVSASSYSILRIDRHVADSYKGKWTKTLYN